LAQLAHVARKPDRGEGQGGQNEPGVQEAVTIPGATQHPAARELTALLSDAHL
jgi:hypothetical protein